LLAWHRKLIAQKYVIAHAAVYLTLGANGGRPNDRPGAPEPLLPFILARRFRMSL
jgi:hypothetical protein